MPTVEPTRAIIAVSFKSAIISFPIAGIMFLTACGIIMRTIVTVQESPIALPASSCPLSTEEMPARIFSEIYAPLFIPKVRIAAYGLKPGIVKTAKHQKNSCNATGVPRKTVV